MNHTCSAIEGTQSCLNCKECQLQKDKVQFKALMERAIEVSKSRKYHAFVNSDKVYQLIKRFDPKQAALIDKIEFLIKEFDNYILERMENK